VNLVSWGFDDSTGQSGQMTVGGKIISVTSRTATFTGRGFFISVVNVPACSASAANNYGPYGSKTAAAALAQYLQGLSAGTVIVGVTADTANDPTGAALAPAVSALQQIGISTAASLAYRAKLAFVAQIGNSAATLYQMLPRNSTYVQIVANIQGNAGSQVTITRVN
jgi:hypothetical protein